MQKYNVTRNVVFMVNTTSRNLIDYVLITLILQVYMVSTWRHKVELCDFGQLQTTLKQRNKSNAKI